MRRISLAVAVLVAGAALAQGSVRVRMTRYRYQRGDLEISVGRPVVTGMADRALQGRINRSIASAFPPGGVAEWSRRAREGEDHLLLDVDATVGLNRKGVLSIHWSGLEMHSKNGQVNEAHPTKHFHGLTLDTRTGKVYSLAQLFRKGSGWREKLDRAIAEQMARDADLKELGREPDAFLEDVRRHSYSYYLTPRGLQIFRIYDNFAAGAIQANVPYREVRSFADPAGPLGRLP